MEMRELEASAPPKNPLHAATVEWHSRWEQGLNPAEEAELQQWLCADPAHQATFDQLNETLRVIREFSADRVALLRQMPDIPPAHTPSLTESTGQPDAPSYREKDRTPRPFQKPRWTQKLSGAFGFRVTALALSCVAILTVGIGWHQWQQQPVYSNSYVAARGQHLDATMPDGSKLALDADTDVEVSLYRQRREVRLKHGQTMFTVTHDPAKPFDVIAGPARVTVVGTRFSVRYMSTGSDAGKVDVTVEEGHVRVTDTTSGRNGDDQLRGGVDLAAGQQVTVSSEGTLGTVSTVAPGSIAPWRKGLVRFASAPLSEALLELERYGPTRLVIRDPEVAALTIGGTYQIGRPEAFASVLPKILPVRLVARDDGTKEIVKAR